MPHAGRRRQVGAVRIRTIRFATFSGTDGGRPSRTPLRCQLARTYVREAGSIERDAREPSAVRPGRSCRSEGEAVA